ncbi:hypothetical protein NPA07_01595 [Mycoplasmopsis caviae]|uniref:Uncharacterized protein n=1 Tax=Mycoplasmopsis caviae TaxID=55603 RepID=A0A3P8K8K0_9BACT|nr:hypothetical protein [Mycoplasmopsis caviae]UUD35548.1 hypothetical protein NPA07_01595 [Mycoplasmopsis caviae]VDR41679.1 Uncharacterised protein [Mycoplasmopsis caviae]
MKIEVNNVKKKLKFLTREKKNDSDVVGDVSYSMPSEIFKFLILLFVATCFVMFQYQDLFFNNDNKIINIIRKIYLYSFGLAFGDVMNLIILGSFLTLCVRWCGSIFKNYYFSWFKPYIKVDYWILRKKIITFVWLTLLFIALIYHCVLVSFRVQNIWYYSIDDVKNIYIKGWYYSFTNQIELAANKSVDYPVAYLNIGFILDSLFNLLYVISFSPYLAIVSALLIWTLAWVFLVTLNPFKYFKNINERKKTIVMIEQYLQKVNSLFYYTPEVKKLFKFYKDVANVLKIDYLKFNFNYLKKMAKKNMNLLSTHTLTAKYFENIKAKKSRMVLETEEFLKTIENNPANSSTTTITLDVAADIKMPSVNAQDLLIHSKGNKINSYISNESTSEFSKDFDLTEERYMSNYVETAEIEAVDHESTKLLIMDLEPKSKKTKKKTKMRTVETVIEYNKINIKDKVASEEIANKNILLITQQVDQIINKKTDIPETQSHTQQPLVNTDELINTSEYTQEIKKDLIDQNNYKTIELEKTNEYSKENNTNEKIQNQVGFLIDSVENTVVINIDEIKQKTNIANQQTDYLDDKKIDESLGFIIPEDSYEVNVQKDDDLKSKEEFIAQLDSIEIDNLNSKEIKLNDNQVNKNKDFQFMFDTNTILINNSVETNNDKVDYFDEDDSWVSPILSDN